jgi:predicted phosphodiesterase
MNRIFKAGLIAVICFVCTISAFAEVPHKQMLDAKAGKIPQGKSVIFITDSHWNVNSGHSTEQMKYVSEKTGIETVVFAGDSYDYANDKEDALRRLRLYTDLCVNAFGDDFHYVIGNHDANSWAVGKGYCTEEVGLIPDTLIYKTTQSHIADKVVFDQVGIKTVQDYAFDSEEQRKEAMAWMKMHWYRDLPSEKIRLIALETGDRGRTARKFTGNAESLFLVQTDFVAKALMSMPEGYNALIVGHQMGFYKGDKKVGTDIAGLRQMMEVVSAYGTSTKVKVSATGASLSKHPFMRAFWKAAGNHEYDFSSVTDPGKTVMLGGHFHRDAFWVASPSDGGLEIENVDPKKHRTINKGEVMCFWVNRDVRRGKNPVMEKGTPSEQCFTVVTFGKNKVTFTRFGAGKDYEFKMK